MESRHDYHVAPQPSDYGGLKPCGKENKNTRKAVQIAPQSSREKTYKLY